MSLITAMKTFKVAFYHFIAMYTYNKPLKTCFHIQFNETDPTIRYKCLSLNLQEAGFVFAKLHMTPRRYVGCVFVYIVL